MKKELSEKINRISDGVLATAGVFSTPTTGARPAGNSRTGSNIFVSNTVASSDNIQAGTALLHMLAMFVTPFNVLTQKDKSALEKGAKLSSNLAFIKALDREQEKQSAGNFGATLIRALGAVTSHPLAVAIAYKLYDHWGVMSPAQKSLAIAAMGVQLHKTEEGKAVCDLQIVSGKDQVFKVSDALKMIQMNKNPYPLVLNWSQIYRLNKVYTDKPTTEGMMDFAVSHNLLGKGITDSAVPGVTKKMIDKSGAKAAPQYGVGAIAAPKGSAAPPDYAEAVETEGSKIMVPKANAHSAAGALMGSLVGTKAGQNGISSDAVTTYSKWKKDDKKAVDKGADGGSALMAGLVALKDTNPFLYSAMVSFLARYAHEHVDGNNPAKYLAALAGIALARVVAGKSEKEADSDGAKLAQGVASANAADFAKLQVEIRAMYANFGVSSKADAYQLSNQAYSEGRIDESDLVAMHQVYDLIYNSDAFGEIGKLLQGKDKGLSIIRSEGPDAKNKMTAGMTKVHREVIKEMTIADVRKRNASRYAKKVEAQESAQAPEDASATQAPQAAPSQGAVTA